MAPFSLPCEKFTDFNVFGLDVNFYAELKKVYFIGSEMQPGVMRAQKRNLLVMKFLCDLFIDEKFYAEFKKVYFK
jgi:hypothetical protein